MSFFGAAHGWMDVCVCVCVCVCCVCVCGGGLSRSCLPTICHTYLTMMKLGTVIILLTFLESLKKILIKVLILMMSAIMATRGLLKIKVF